MDKPHKLASLSLPPEHALKRQPPPRCKISQQSFWDQYDHSTIVYDCIYSTAKRQLRLFLPKAFNLKESISNARFYADGEVITTGKWRFNRHFDTLDFKLNRTPRQLSMTMADTTLETEVSIDNTASFAGLNVLFTVSKDNKLEWIADWIAYHQKVHGANAVVIADNASTQYSEDELLSVIKSVPGIKGACVLSVPMRYGPGKQDTTHFSDAGFLQPALLNLMMMRYLSQARAVLNVDIDELVVPTAGVSIFDAVSRSLLGLMTFQGHWRYAGVQSDNVLHSDHTNAKESDKPCTTKYALRPNSILASRCLQVHTLAGVNRKLLCSRKFYYLHCRGISTGWKYSRDEVASVSAADQEEIKLMDSVFKKN